MLTYQQAAAKEAAHRRFDFPVSVAAQERGNIKHKEDLPRFTRGVEGIGVAEEVIRIYVLEGHEEAVDIPSEFEGLRTERVSTPGFGTLAPKQQSTKAPVPCGVSIGHHKIGAGTLGCLVEVSDSVCILSNNHVLADTNNGMVGDDILQPGPYDQPPGGSTRRIAGLTDFEPLRFGGAINHIDAAIATLDRPDLAVPKIKGINKHTNPPVAAFLKQSVVKHGRTTSLTFGTVADISYDGNVSYNGRVAYFENQIAIIGQSGPFSDDGDSGSLVLEHPCSSAVGLLFAGDGIYSLANRIQPVLNRFGATIVTT